jgi:WD40 repeat protein
LHTLKGHSAAVFAVAFSPDGKTVVSGSGDGTLRVWDIASGVSLHTLKGHSDVVYAVAFSPDGKTVVSGSLDRTLRVWPILRLNDLISWVRANRYVPELTCEQRARYDVEPLCSDRAAGG